MTDFIYSNFPELLAYGRRTKNYEGFREAAHALFKATGQFVDIIDGEVYTAPMFFKNRPEI